MGELTFYFDVNFGTRLPKALRHLRPPVDIEWHQNQRFRQDMPDDEWLAIVGKKDWIVFSHDRKFHTEAMESAAVKQHNVGCFYLPAANDPVWDKCSIFIRSFNRIRKLAVATEKPFIFDLKRNGHLKKIDLP